MSSTASPCKTAQVQTALPPVGRATPATGAGFWFRVKFPAPHLLVSGVACRALPKGQNPVIMSACH